MAGESKLDSQVFTAGATPDYLAHYASILQHLPNPGVEYQKAAAADAQRANQLAQYQLSLQKAKAFYELYPQFKAAQIAKINAEAGLLPIRGELYRAQADLAKSRANQNNPDSYKDTNFFESELGGLTRTPAPTTPAAGQLLRGDTNPMAPVPDLLNAPYPADAPIAPGARPLTLAPQPETLD